MWYCKVEFTSGKEKNIVFENQYKANSFYNNILNNNKKKQRMDFINDNYDKLLINLNNIETVTKPKEYKEDNGVINN